MRNGEEKVLKNAWKTKFKKVEKNIISLRVDPKDPKPVKSILDEKENQIQLIKKKLKILNTAHVQQEELIALQMEKYKHYQEIQKHMKKYKKENEGLNIENEELKRNNI